MKSIVHAMLLGVMCCQILQASHKQGQGKMVVYYVRGALCTVVLGQMQQGPLKSSQESSIEAKQMGAAATNKNEVLKAPSNEEGGNPCTCIGCTKYGPIPVVKKARTSI